MMKMDENYGQPTTATITAEDNRQSPPPNPTPSEPARQESPSISDTFGQRPPTPTVKPENYSLNTRQVLALFESAGLPRSHRSIERYCKEGKLDSFLDPDEDRYYATRASVDLLIGQMKQIQARQSVATPPSQPSPSAPTFSRHDAPPTDSITDATREAPTTGKKEYEEKIMSLEVDKRVRDQLISQLKEQIREDREHFTNRLEENARLVGQLETRLLQLEGPRKAREAIEDAQTSSPIEGAPSRAFSNDLKE